MKSAVALGRTAGIDLLLRLERAGALTPVSLDLYDELPDEQVEALARMLGTVKRRSSWWIGDLIVFAEGTMGEKYAQVAHWTGLSEDTLANYVWVCRQIPKSRRKENVPFACHTEVAAMEPKEQNYWLRIAARDQLSQRQLRALIRAQDQSPENPDAPPASSATGRAPQIESIARRIWRTASSDGNGYYRVPAELIAQLAAALGEED